MHPFPNFFGHPVPVTIVVGGTAPTFVGSKGATFNSASSQAISLTDLADESGSTATLQDGDFVLLALMAQNNGTDVTYTPASGWTLECDMYEDDTQDTNFTVWSKRMGASPDTSVTVPGSIAIDITTSVVIHAFRGVNSTYKDVPNVTASGLDVGQPIPPGITPVTGGALIYCAGGASMGSAAGGVFTNPGDLSSNTNDFKSAWKSGLSQSSCAGAGFVAWDGAGAFNPLQWGGGRVGLGECWCALTMALRPS